VENPKPKWQWPTKRLDQVFLVIYALLLLVPIYMLGWLFFSGEEMRYPSPPIPWIPVIAVFLALVVSILATQRRGWRMWGWSFFMWAIALRHIPGLLPVGLRFFVELLISLAYCAAIIASGAAILRGESNKSPRNEEPE
jgi:hypothetical protein